MDWHYILTLEMKAFFFIWFVIFLLVITQSQSNKHVKYKTITIQKVLNLGNYESQRIEITAEVESDCEDYLHDCLTELNATITDALNKFKQQHEYQKKVEESEKKTVGDLPW